MFTLLRCTTFLACLTLAAAASASASAEPDASALPPDSAYVTVSTDGRLVTDGQPVRFWGAIGSFPGKQQTIDGDPYYAQRKIAQRLEDLGFNMVRFWHYGDLDTPYRKGDASRRDVVDFFLAELGRRDIRVWSAGTGGGGHAQPEDVGIVDDPATAEAWRAAMTEWTQRDQKDRIPLLHSLALVWDERLEAKAIDNMRRAVNHVNQHSGLRMADDPTFAVWEISNEQWWMQKMVRGQWQKLPRFFQRSLIARWHDYLRDKYASEPELARAWGFLLPGESLERGTVLLAPMSRGLTPAQLNDGNPQALAAFDAVDQPYGRDDFTRQRGADVLEFFTGLLLDHKLRWKSEIKTWGKSCRLAPTVLDTGIGYEIQSQYLHQHGDASAHATYIRGATDDPMHRRYPFFSGLEQAPRMSMGVPWVEHNKAPGQPTLIYETQIGMPAKYRAEFPLRHAALGSIQDWSAINWHYFSVNDFDFTKDQPFTGRLSWPGPGQYQFVYTYDEVQQSAMRAASAIFRHFHVPPAAEPTTFVWGRKALFDPDSMDYAGSYGRPGLNMSYTTWARGSRILIDPAREDDEARGEVEDPLSDRYPNPLRPTAGVEIDHQRGYLKMNTPGVASWVGFLNAYGEDVTFDRDVTLRGVTFANPADAPYPVSEDERFLAFTLVSETAQPLESTPRAMISLVSTAFNRGMRIEGFDGPFGVKGKRGELPVQVTRVSATIEAPAIAGMRYTLRDFHMRSIGEGVVPADGRLAIEATDPVFVVELSRP